jgi:hypothetical protein
MRSARAKGATNKLLDTKTTLIPELIGRKNAQK